MELDGCRVDQHPGSESTDQWRFESYQASAKHKDGSNSGLDQGSNICER